MAVPDPLAKPPVRFVVQFDHDYPQAGRGADHEVNVLCADPILCRLLSGAARPDEASRKMACRIFIVKTALQALDQGRAWISAA